MANYFTAFLSGVAQGALNPKGLVSNWQHATRLFIDDTYRLSPRTKFMWYAQFEFDKTVLKSGAFTAKHTEEAGLLVKTADLPKFNFDTVTKNQYNRKKIVYKQINYEPVSITLHDDSQGIINAMWALYYGYYVADRANPNAAYGATHYRKTGLPTDQFRYGLDNSISTPFFKSITLYTMSKRRFNSYTLVNPRIKSWNHGQVDYSASEFLESTMQLEYEAVQYNTGSVSRGSPKGFATLHYDSVPSPLSVAGGGVANLLGEGGVLDGIDQVFGNISNGSAFGSVGGFLGTAIGALNTYKNASKLTASSLTGEAVNILSNPANIANAVSSVGGVIGSVFPSNAGRQNQTQASPSNLTTGN